MESTSKFLETSPTIDQIDQRIQSLRDEIYTLQQYRNTRLTSISKLPRDVLSIIFEHMALSRYKPPVHPQNRRPYLTWVPVSQVCRLWRNIALDTPRMWGCIYDHTHPEFAKLLLERAKTSPLYLRGCGLPSQDDVIKLLFQHSSQLKEIDLPSYSVERLSWLTTLQQAPMLDSLALGIFGYTVRSKVRFTPDVEPGVAPPLRHLLLNRCILDLDVPFFSHLQTLDITVNSSRPTDLSILDVVLALRNMAHLEVLKLRNVTGGSTEIPNEIRVHLPRLNIIEVVAPDLRGLTIFLHISCPLVQRIVAAVQIDMEEHASLEPIARAIYEVVPVSASPSNVQAKLIPSISISTNRIDANICFDLNLRTGQLPFQVSITGPTHTSTYLALCSSVPACTPFILDPDRLRYSPKSDILDVNGLQDFLQHLERVQELHVRSTGDLLTLLSPPARAGSNNDWAEPSPPPLASLKRIVLNKLLKEKLPGVNELLAARKTAGVGIEALRISRRSHGMTKDDIECLKQHVEKLTFASPIL